MTWVLHDWKAFGDSEIPTPHLDRLAARGTKPAGALHRPAPICVPSRMGLMSGKFPARFWCVGQRLCAGSEPDLDASRSPWPNVLKKYLATGTANIGKWHLGGNTSTDSGDELGGFLFKPPHERGFEEFVGITGGMNNFCERRGELGAAEGREV